MSLGKELLDTLKSMSALEKRTEDILHQVERLNTKIDGLTERVIKTEMRQEALKEKHDSLKEDAKREIKNEVMSEIKVEIALFKAKLDNTPGQSNQLPAIK